MASLQGIAVSTLTGFGLALTWSSIGSAATIAVNTTTCTFDQAVQALNTQTHVGGCAAGNGSADKITIPAGSFTIETSGPDQINRSVTIAGAGRSTSILNVDTPVALLVTPDGPAGLAITVTIQDLTLQASGTAPFASFGIVTEDLQDPPYSLGCTLNLSDVLITQFGGGLVNSGSDPSLSKVTITSSVFEDTASEEGNAAIVSSGSGLTNIVNSTIENNLGGYYGGGVSVTDGTVNISGSTLEGNVGEGNGGGLYIGSGTVTVSNSTFYDNETENVGGAIFVGANVDPTTFKMTFSTLANNNGDNGVGGLFEDSAPAYPISLAVSDSIIATNTQGGDGAYAAYIDVFANFATSGLNLIGTSVGAFNPPRGTIFNSNPKFGTLSHVDNWPDTLPLLPGSPAIDQEASASPAGATALDERGFPRPVDGNGDGKSAYDLGAFEYDPWQVERLIVAAKSSDAFTIPTDTGYSNQQGGWLQANAKNDFVTFTVPVPTGGGTFDVKVRAKLGTNRGEYQLSTATSLTGTYSNLGGVQNLYTTATNLFTEVDLGHVTFSSGGNKYFKFTVAGKSSASSNYYLTLDYIKLTKQ